MSTCASNGAPSRGRRAATVLAGLALAATLAACSSSGSSGGSTTGSTTATIPTTTSSSSTPAVAANVAAATAALEKATAAPTKIGVTEPLKTAPAKGGSVIYLQCEYATCAPPGQGMKAAAEAIGWGYRTLNYKVADPATLVAAMQQALSYKPTAIFFVAVPEAVWGGEVAAYRKAGVKIITGDNEGVTINDTVIGSIVGDKDTAIEDAMVSNWFISDSKGAGNGLVVAVPAVPGEASFKKRMHDNIGANCPGCKLSDLDLTTTQLGTAAATSAVVSAVQKDPSIKYVLSAYGPQAPGLPAALQAAGLSKVKIAGFYGGAADFAAIKAGQESAFTTSNGTYEGWLAVDVALRNQQGIDFDPTFDGGQMYRLYTADNMTDPDEATNFNLPADFPAQFKAVWKVS